MPLFWPRFAFFVADTWVSNSNLSKLFRVTAYAFFSTEASTLVLDLDWP